MDFQFMLKICSVLLIASHQVGGVPARKKLKIAGGSNAKLGEFPYMVAVLYKGFFTCGGSIISEEWVLTAAHCVFNRTSSAFSVVSGTIEMDGDSGEETPVSQVIYHEDYTPSANFANDMAVLRLSVALDFNSDVCAVDLPAYQEIIPAFSETHIMGWGYEQYNGTPSYTLQKALVYVIPPEVCSPPYAYYGVNILVSNVCAGTSNGGVGQCTGDSGGPMVYSVDSTQIGIVSFSAKPCGNKYFPGVYTKVAQYRDWITNKTGV